MKASATDEGRMAPAIHTSGAHVVLERIYSDGCLPSMDGSATFPCFPVGLTQRPGEGLAALIRAEGARSTIEVGMALGLSTLWIMQGCDGPHVAIDPNQRSTWLEAGLRAIHEAGFEDRMSLVEEDSRLALPAMVADRTEFDFAFVDGVHRFEYVLLDLCYALRLVRPGGLVVLDDRWMPAVRAAADYAVRNLGISLEPMDDPEADRRMIVLRRPETEFVPAWDGFEAFGAEGVASPAEVDAERGCRRGE